ncbi:MAG: hypothetical protein IT168_11630 [Bryobacterales bacterium]|nr:hypothetical protein [Bryobacterales bacterium]
MVLGVPHTFGRNLVCVAVMVLSITATCGVTKLTRARSLAQAATIESLTEAIALDPDNAQYWMKRADLKHIAGLDATSDLLQAAAINSLDASVWIQLGLNAERQGDIARAEKFLLRAATVSKLYQPRWTLANFYFRRDSLPEFWRWIGEALKLCPGACDAIFQLCWRAAADDANELLGQAMPDNPEVLGAYTQFLLTTNRLKPAETVLKRLYAGNLLPRDQSFLLTAADKFLEAGMVEPALNAWAALNGTTRSDSGPREGNLITNPEFARKPLGRGFDWRIQEAPGVSVDRGVKLLAVFFSRPQLSTHQAVWQYVPLVPRQHYELQFEYRTSGLTGHDGVSWRILRAQDSSVAIAEATMAPSETWLRESVQFTTPETVAIGRLSFGYSRDPGAPKISGSVVTRALRLTKLQ